VDPLLSTGFPLALLGIHRVAAMLKQDWDSERWGSQLDVYARNTAAELNATARLVGALYKSGSNFQQFISLSLLYFAAASFSEAARRLDRPELAGGFLLHGHPTFGPAMRRCCELVNQASLAEEVRKAIEPIDIAGLGRTDRGNWYPVDPQDTLAAAGKLGVGTDEIRAMFTRCGVSCASA
jgi:FADH2 O2-dependent halogenase